MPQSPFIIATKTPSSDVLVFDYSKHPSRPGSFPPSTTHHACFLFLEISLVQITLSVSLIYASRDIQRKGELFLGYITSYYVTFTSVMDYLGITILRDTF